MLLKIVCRCFWLFNMAVVKNLMKKIPFYDVFSKCVCSFSTSQFFFVRATLFGQPYFKYSRGKQFLTLMIMWQLVYWKDVSVGTEYMIFPNETHFNLIDF